MLRQIFIHLPKSKNASVENGNLPRIAMQCVVMRRRQAVVLVLRMSTPVSMKIMASAK